MKRIQLYTTSVVEGREIEKYLGMVTANQVIGTSFLTELTAGISDFFGGYSGAFRKSMNLLYDNVESQLLEKVMRLGGDGVVGVSINYENISGKGMSMFMATMQGTAVKFKEESVCCDENLLYNEVSADDLERELSIKKIKNKLDRQGILREDDWKVIMDNKIVELAKDLYNSYKKKVEYGDDTTSKAYSNKMFNSFVQLLDYDSLVELFYSTTDFIPTELIIENKVFNAEGIIKIFEAGKIDEGVELLSADKQYYNKEDLLGMRKLIEIIDGLPDVGKITEVSGVFGGKKQRFTCVCGRENDGDREYCSSCSRNIKGLRESQIKDIDAYRNKVEVLGNIMER